VASRQLLELRVCKTDLVSDDGAQVKRLWRTLRDQQRGVSSLV
jgi:hypothetical protein